MPGSHGCWLYCDDAHIEPDDGRVGGARFADARQGAAGSLAFFAGVVGARIGLGNVLRKTLILVFFLLVGAAAWPVYVGMQIETALDEPFTGHVGDLRIQHVVTAYERGRYSARATSLLHVLGNGLDFEVELEHRIDHRLLGAAVHSRSGAAPSGDIPPLWAAAFAQARPRADSWLGLRGGVSSRFSSQPVKVHGGDDTVDERAPFHLEMGAGQGGLAYSPERMVLSFDTDRVDFGDGELRLLLRQLYFGLLVHPGPDGRYGPLPDYDIGLGSGSLALTRGDHVLLGLDSLQMSSNQNSVASSLDSLWRMRAEALRSGELELETLDLNLTALRWDRPTLLRFIKDFEGVRAMSLATDLRTGLLLGMVMEGLQKMVENDPLLQGYLHLSSESGDHIRLNLGLGLGGDAAGFAARPLESVELELDIEIGVELIEGLVTVIARELGMESRGGMDLQAWLELAVAEQWVRIENEILYSLLRMEDGRLLINSRDQTVLLLALVFGLARGMF